MALREVARFRSSSDAAPAPIVLHGLITSRTVPETIEGAGEQADVRTRVGSTRYIKAQMALTGTDLRRRALGALLLPGLLGRRHRAPLAADARAGRSRGSARLRCRCSARTCPPYPLSGEINSVVKDVPAAYARIVEAYTGSAVFDELDGLTVTGQVAGDAAWWWFNVRPSNTEPLLRLNVEAMDLPTMEATATACWG